MRFSWLAAVMAACICGAARGQSAADFPRAIIGQTVNITLTDGTELPGLHVLRVLAGKQQGTLQMAHCRMGRGSANEIPANQIAEIELFGQPLDVVYDSTTRTVAPSAEKRERRLAERAGMQQKIDSGAANAWPAVTSDEFIRHTEEERVLARAAIAKVPGLSMQCFETDRWLVHTDLAEQQARHLAAALDQGYAETAVLLGVPEAEIAFRGKVPVYLFSKVGDFGEFNRLALDFAALNASTCFGHWDESGRVVLTFAHATDQVEQAANAAFMAAGSALHRYRSLVELPFWIRAGFDSLVAARCYPKSTYSELLIEGRSRLQGDQFIEAVIIEGQRFEYTDYGVAAQLVGALLEMDHARFQQLLIALKAGLTAEEAIAWAYHRDTTALVRMCGARLGIANLQIQPP